MVDTGGQRRRQLRLHSCTVNIARGEGDDRPEGTLGGQHGGDERDSL